MAKKDRSQTFAYKMGLKWGEEALLHSGITVTAQMAANDYLEGSISNEDYFAGVLFAIAKFSRQHDAEMARRLST